MGLKRLRWVMAAFSLAVALPLAVVLVHAYQGLAGEERARLEYFVAALFDGMQTEMAALVEREESRGVDAYNAFLTPPDTAGSAAVPSPLAQVPGEAFIVGYLQNNPDGSFQTPLAADPNGLPAEQRRRYDRLAAVNAAFNRHKHAAATAEAPKAKKERPAVEAVTSPDEKGFADQFFDRSRQTAQREYLGRKQQRVETITPRQALNVARQDAAGWKSKSQPVPAPASSAAAPAAPMAKPAGRITEMETEERGYRSSADLHRREPAQPTDAAEPRPLPLRELPAAEIPAPSLPDRFEAEVAPMQAVFVDPRQVFVYRRVAINDRIYRQGFVLEVAAFLGHLAAVHFDAQPMAGFARLDLTATAAGRPLAAVSSGARAAAARFQAERVFPTPFDFIGARLASARVPAAAARRTLNGMAVALVAVLLVGITAIYFSVRAVVDLSERRSRFVASVTHELKTPLTNIRLYIEMLEQGIARDTEREQEYFHILGSESARLSRLINNVLELSRLERRQRRFEQISGDLTEVLEKVRAAMGEKLRQEGFTLTVETASGLPPAVYDREAMIQVLINLLDNSIKFGRSARQRRIRIRVAPAKDRVCIAVSDTGPGIPAASVKKIFDDFYRGPDTEARAVAGTGIGLARAVAGTGIGLALVHKLVAGMGGSVAAANNDPPPGCTVTITLPAG